jgi:hypothetical protein
LLRRAALGSALQKILKKSYRKQTLVCLKKSKGENNLFKLIEENQGLCEFLIGYFKNAIQEFFMKFYTADGKLRNLKNPKKYQYKMGGLQA